MLGNSPWKCFVFKLLTLRTLHIHRLRICADMCCTAYLFHCYTNPRDQHGCMNYGRASPCSPMRRWNAQGCRRRCPTRRSKPGCWPELRRSIPAPRTRPRWRPDGRSCIGITHPFEATENWVMWREQKAREGIRDVGREAMVDHVRDRFWLQDESPARQAERQASVWRSIHREHQRTGRPLQGPRVEAPRLSFAEITARLTQLRAMLARMSQEEPQAGAALNVRLSQREERERGLSF